MKIVKACALVVLFASTIDADAEPGFLGIRIRYEEAPAGAGRFLVQSVVPKGPAENGGLSAGDRITQVNGVAFRYRDWTATEKAGGPFTWLEAGNKVIFTYLRGDETRKAEVVAASYPHELAEQRAGYVESQKMNLGADVVDRLARRQAMVGVTRLPTGEIEVASEELDGEEEKALAHYLNAGTLRGVLTKIEQGKPRKVRFRISETGNSRIELLPAQP